jgi:hypothetical protein
MVPKINWRKVIGLTSVSLAGIFLATCAGDTNQSKTQQSAQTSSKQKSIEMVFHINDKKFNREVEVCPQKITMFDYDTLISKGWSLDRTEEKLDCEAQYLTTRDFRGKKVNFWAFPNENGSYASAWTMKEKIEEDGEMVEKQVIKEKQQQRLPED